MLFRSPAVMLGWMDNWQYAAALPTRPWRGQMTIPRKLWLRRTADGIRLLQEPVDELQELKGGNSVIKNSVRSTNGHSFELRSEMTLGTAQEVGWKLLANNGSYTVVGYERGAHKLFVDRMHSGLTGFNKDFPSRNEAPITLQGDVLRLRVLVDRCSVEVFAGEGEIAMTELVFPPQGADGIEVWKKGGEPGKITASFSELRSIWSR